MLRKPLFLLLLWLGAGWLVAAHVAQPALPVWATEACESFQCNKDDEEGYLRCIKDKQQCWLDNISEARNTAVTLSNTIAILNGQIKVQELQIDQTQAEIALLEKEIDELTQRISGLEVSLDRLTTIMIERVQQNYKRHRLSPITLLLETKSMNNFLSHIKYLQLAQTQTTEAMKRAESQRLTYDEQKTLKENKQTELDTKRRQLVSQQAELDRQRAGQQLLLNETRNNEARFQSELAKTQAELEAIQSIIAGRGDETKVGGVNQGDTIASLIVGASACSTGSHLHFEVAKDGAHRNPADYLKNVDVVWQNQPDGPFGFNGNWEWPLHNPAKINQGYGNTWYATVKRAYGGAPHTGLDIVSKSAGDYTILAVKEGTLFRGSIACGGGLLRYVKVEHKEDGINTYYLHVNY